MSGLQVLLMMSCQDDFPFIQYFPSSYEQPHLINELLIVSKFFKNCGKGCLLNQNNMYFYKTYIPNIDSNLIIKKNKIFLLFLCDIFYKQKYIDEFTDNIFILLEKNVFENDKLKKNIENTINSLFDIYKNINNKEEIYLEYVKNIMSNSMEGTDNGTNNTSLDNDILTRKRIDSECIKKTDSLRSIIGFSNVGLIENIEMTKITENDTDLVMMFKADKYNYYSMKMKIYKKIKVINIIIFSFLEIVLFILFFLLVF